MSSFIAADIVTTILGNMNKSATTWAAALGVLLFVVGGLAVMVGSAAHNAVAVKIASRVAGGAIIGAVFVFGATALWALAKGWA